MGILSIVGIAIIAGVGYVISVYNTLQKLKTRIAASIQEIGNQLKRQANLIPNLTESAKTYLKHEKDIFKMLTDARKAVDDAQGGDTAKIDQAMEKLNQVIPKLNIMVESNPELKADGVITKLMNELRDTADKIMYARRAVIDLSADYNQRLVMFPSSIIANMFNFTQEKGIEVAQSGKHTQVSDQELKEVKVDL